VYSQCIHPSITHYHAKSGVSIFVIGERIVSAS